MLFGIADAEAPVRAAGIDFCQIGAEVTFLSARCKSWMTISAA